MSCHPQCFYLCVPDTPIVPPIAPVSTYPIANYNNFLSEYDVIFEDPLRPHITAIITNHCQGEALRTLVNNAQLAQTEYNNAMHQCLIAAGFGTAAIDILNQGMYKMIVQRMKSAGGKGIAGYRAAMITLGLGNLTAAVCVNDSYTILQTKYTQYESDFKVKYNEPCN